MRMGYGLECGGGREAAPEDPNAAASVSHPGRTTEFQGVRRSTPIAMSAEEVGLRARGLGRRQARLGPEGTGQSSSGAGLSWG